MKFIPRYLLYSLFLMISFISCCVAEPAALYFDPAITHNMLGVNRYPVKQKDWTFDLHLSPFFQHATGARDRDGKKVPEGDRLGRWEMLALFWEGDNEKATTEASPKTFNSTNYSTLYTLSQDLAAIGVTDVSYGGRVDKDGDFSVAIDYEKLGLRGELNVAMASGFGLAIKGGIVDFKQTPSFTDVSTSTDEEVVAFLADLMFTTTRQKVFNEIGLNVDRYETMVFEDTFVKLCWSNAFKFDDEEGNHVVSVIPYLGAGVWIPTGKKKDQDKAFSLPSGHDGFWGITLDGALNFQFPGTVLINIGAGAAFYETKTLHNYRAPSHKYQYGIYPWKTSIRKTLGPAWNFNVSLYAKDIVDKISVYFDYLYSEHERDTITIVDSDSTRKALFIPSKLEEESAWKSQTIQLGFNYQLSPNLAFGFTGQAHLSGVRVYKTHTIMGTVTFTF